MPTTDVKLTKKPNKQTNKTKKKLFYAYWGQEIMSVIILVHIKIYYASCQLLESKVIFFKVKQTTIYTDD